MTDIKKFDSTGSLVWEITDAAFTGKTAVDNDGNVFALFHVSASSGEIKKYSAAGALLDSASYAFQAEDISFGFDGYLYICGGGGGGDLASDGVIKKYSTALISIFTSTVSSEGVSSDFTNTVLQVRADVYGYIYTVHDSTTEKIRKYNITSGTPVKVWGVTDFDEGTPYIAITKQGEMAVSGLQSLGGWADITGPEYWQSVNNLHSFGHLPVDAWDGEKWDVTGTNTSSSWGKCQFGPLGTWQQDVYDAYVAVGSTLYVDMRLTFTTGIREVSAYQIAGGSLFVAQNFPTSPYTGNSIRDWTPDTGYGGYFIDDYSGIQYSSANPDSNIYPGGVALEVDWDEAGGPDNYITKIEVYLPGSPYSVIASITSAGEISGIIDRDKTTGILAIDRDGGVLVQEDTTYITKIDPVSGDDIWSYDTEQEVTAFVTDNTGIAAEDNSMTTNMVFTGSGFVAGTTQEIDIVWPSAAPIEFTGSADVVGHTRIISPPPAEIAFTGAGSPVVPIIVPTTDLLFESTIQVVTPILAPSAEMVFSSDVDIDGSTTVIITPPAEIVFAPTDVLAYYLTAPTSGTGIYVEAGQMVFANDTAITAYTLTPNADIEATFPSLEMSAYAGATIEGEFSFSLEMTGTAGHAGGIETDLPGFSLTAYAGGHAEVSFPVFSLSMEATITVLAALSAQLPALGFSGIASRASEGDLDINLPMLQAAMELTTGIVGSIAGTLPRLSMGVVGLPGVTADLEGTFRIMQFSAEGGPSGPGTISAELPMLEVELESGSISSDVLRYVRERVA